MQLLDTTQKWRVPVYAAAILAGLAYLCWSIWGNKVPIPGQVVQAQPVKVIESLPKKVITTKVQVIKDPIKATEKLGIDPPRQHEEVQTAIVVPPLKYGGTSTTFLNVSTGQSRTVIASSPAPWFRFERENRIGAEVGIGSNGKYAQVDYQRDVLSIKGVILAGKLSATTNATEVDLRAGVRLEYRW